jgi:uncharacterized repeat protein (TIGR03803 family)
MKDLNCAKRVGGVVLLGAAKLFHLIAAVIFCLLLGCPGGARAQTFTSLYKFTGTPADGSEPLWMHLIQATDGNFYGTTEFGGVSNVGTVFKITPGGTPTILYQFKGYTVNDGAFPEAGLVQGSDGNFYGTTYEGGTNAYGTVFKMTPAGVLTNIHIFQGPATHDGRWPFSPLTQGTDGYLYGTTSAGGTRGYGTVFQMDYAGNLTIIHSFTNGADGGTPYAGVFEGSDGYFYGTTQSGGTNGVEYGGYGTVYKVNAASNFIPLHEFGSTADDGQNPIGGIIQGYTGDYFGTTFNGGSNTYGVVFRITSAGVLTNLYQFGGPANDGLDPRAGLTQGSDGYLYGTTYEGGTNGVGTLFKIGPSGGLIYLHDFDAFIGDGLYPAASPVEGYDGNYYGVTYMGGTNGGLGVVYKLAYPVSANPNQPNSPNIATISNTNTGPGGTNTVVVGISSVAGETYQLEFANALPATVWSNFPGGFVSNAIGGPLLFSNFVSSGVSQRFYRFEITP